MGGFGGLSLSETIILAAIGAVPLGIAILCYVWMKNSRASQRRMEEHQRETVDLLRRIHDDLRSRN
jgi:hypothetical protein